jgi:hypothetical protein
MAISPPRRAKERARFPADFAVTIKDPQWQCAFSPTHKRTEGRAPVWGSAFTTKVAEIQGDMEEIAPTLNMKLWNPVVVTDWWWRATPFEPDPVFESI